MLFVVNLVSALVHLYSTDYMSHDPHLPRFMAYLSLFTFFMLMLITGDNFVILFEKHEETMNDSFLSKYVEVFEFGKDCVENF